MSHTTTSTVLQLIRQAMPGIEIAPGDANRPLSDLGLDSLDVMSVLLAVQEHWNLELTAEEIQQMTTPNDVSRTVNRLVSMLASAAA